MSKKTVYLILCEMNKEYKHNGNCISYDTSPKITSDELRVAEFMNSKDKAITYNVYKMPPLEQVTEYSVKIN